MKTAVVRQQLQHHKYLSGIYNLPSTVLCTCHISSHLIFITILQCAAYKTGWFLSSFYKGGSWESGKEPVCQFRRHKRPGFNPWVGKIPWRRDGNPPMVLAWRSPWTEEPGGLWPTGLWRVRHDWAQPGLKVTAHTRRGPADAPACPPRVLMAQEVGRARLESACSPSSCEGRGS